MKTSRLVLAIRNLSNKYRDINSKVSSMKVKLPVGDYPGYRKVWVEGVMVKRHIRKPHYRTILKR